MSPLTCNSFRFQLEAAFVAHMKSTKRIIDNFKKRDYIYEHSDDTLPLNLETTTTAPELAAGADASASTSVSASSSASPPETTRVQRVYKTYSSHR